MGFDAVFVNGTTGVGKSTALQALGALLAEREVPHALVDFDYLRLAWPTPVDDPFNLQLGLRNLSAVAGNYRAAGVERLALAYVLSNRQDAEAFARAIGGERMLVVRLRAQPPTVEARLRQRHGSEAPWELPWFLERFNALQDELDAAAIDDVVIDVDDLTPTETAYQVMMAAGWWPAIGLPGARSRAYGRLVATAMPYRPLPVSQDDVVYEFGPDSAPGAADPGIVEELTLNDSEIFPGTTRRIWLHRPAGHLTAQESAVMFFNDGWWYLDPDGDVRGGIVLDNLAASGAIPPMIGVFVDPGMIEVDGRPTKHRNAEYDAFDDRYARFLIEEILPLVQARYAVSPDPGMRGICGGSSGGNAALTAAWSRPDSLRRVITYNSSFTQMPGGNPYPHLLASEPRKNLRIFLQGAHRDQGWNSPDHNWFAEALETAAALARAGYDFRLVVGDGPHSANHGGALLPDALRWLWSDLSR